jgi:hypothetical protein
MKTREPVELKQARARFARARRIALANIGDPGLMRVAESELADYHRLRLRLAIERAIAADGPKLSAQDRLELAGPLILSGESS